MKLRKAITLYRKEGFRRCLAKIISFAIGQLVSVRFVYKLVLNQIKFIPQDKGFTIKEMDFDDLDLTHSLNEQEISQKRYECLKEIIKSRTSSCYILKNDDDNICGYCCLGFGEEGHAKIFGRIRGMDIRKNGYLFRDYTFKKYRRQGIQAFAIYSRLLILKNKGYKTATTRISKDNIVSEHSYEKLGFRKCLIEIHLHLFNIFPNSNYLVIPLRN